MTLAAAALLLLAAQDAATPPAPVQAAAQTAPRFEVRAMTLEQALPIVGERFGVKMRAAPAIGRELVLVSITSTDAAAFRDQMAKAFSAEWREEEGVWYFNRSNNLRAAEARENRRKRIEKLTKALEKSRKESGAAAEYGAADAEGLVKDLKAFMALPKPQEGKYDEAYYTKARALDVRGPSNRLIRRVIDRLPIELLDNDGEPTRTVYSTRPTKMQLAMPIDLTGEVQRYVREQNAWADAMSASGLGDQNGAMYTSLLYRKDRVDKIPATVLLIVQDRWGTRQVGIKAYDAAGRSVLEESEGVGGMWDMDESNELQKRMKENPRKVKLEIAPESKRFSEIFADGGDARAKTTFTLQDYLPYMDVAKRDPMSYGASDVMLSLARGENRNLVVRMDDSYFYLNYWGQQPEMAKDGMDATVLEYFATSTEEAGWTRMVPRDPIAAARSNYDRRDLARAMALIAQGGRMTVERQAELALITPSEPDQKPMYRLLGMMMRQQRTWGGDEFLKLYGVLTPAQRQQARTEAGLSFSGLGPDALAILGRIAYQSDEWRLNYNPTPEYQKSLQNDGNGQDPNQELFYGGYLREPTFSLPDGLSRGGTIHISGDTQDKIKTGPTTRSWGVQEGQIMTAEELASNEYQRANPKRFPWAQDEWNQRNLEQLMLVNQQSVNVEVRFDPRITSNSVLTSDEAIAGGPYTLKTLPKSFLDAYAKAMKEQEAAYKDQPLPDYGDSFSNRNRGGGTPPPAR